MAEREKNGDECDREAYVFITIQKSAFCTGFHFSSLFPTTRSLLVIMQIMATAPANISIQAPLLCRNLW